jgi:hypothetical protein
MFFKFVNYKKKEATMFFKFVNYKKNNNNQIITTSTQLTHMQHKVVKPSCQLTFAFFVVSLWLLLAVILNRWKTGQPATQ